MVDQPTEERLAALGQRRQSEQRRQGRWLAAQRGLAEQREAMADEATEDRLARREVLHAEQVRQRHRLAAQQRRHAQRRRQWRGGVPGHGRGACLRQRVRQRPVFIEHAAGRARQSPGCAHGDHRLSAAHGVRDRLDPRAAQIAAEDRRDQGLERVRGIGRRRLGGQQEVDVLLRETLLAQGGQCLAGLRFVGVHPHDGGAHGSLPPFRSGLRGAGSYRTSGHGPTGSGW